MNYFENLPIININDQEFRNIFQRVIVDYVKEEQMFKYQINDFETLPSIANKNYGSVHYWWVIALLNNIYDINYDIPLSTQQIESLAQQMSYEYGFGSSLIQSATLSIPAGSTSREIAFLNPDNKPYFVSIIPNSNQDHLGDYNEYGINKLNNTTFNIIIEEALEVDVYFTYGIFIQPTRTEVINTSTFSEFFDELIKEADQKRTIKLLRNSDLSSFITNFMLALQNRPLINAEIIKERSFKKSINLLSKYQDQVVPDYGFIVKISEANLSGLGEFTEVYLPEYDYSQQIQITGRPTTEEIGNVGEIVIKNNFLRPKIYNSGTAESAFDLMIIAPDNKPFSSENEILQSGTEQFGGNYNPAIITINNFDVIKGINDIGLMITPVINSVESLGNIGKFSFRAIDKNTIEVYNSGTSTTRFFWSVFESNFSTFFKKLGGYLSFIDLPIAAPSTNFDKVCLLVSPIWIDFNYNGSDGEYGYRVMNQNTVRLFNAGEAGAQFTYKTITNASQFGTVDSNGMTPVDLYIEDHINIEEKEDICLALTQLVSSVDNLSNAGNFGIKLIDKNNVQIFNTGGLVKFKYFTLSNEVIEHGIATFPGKDNELVITLSFHDEITHSSNICMMITPLVDDANELGNVGEYSFKAISNTEIHVYNTGNNLSRFKWAVVKGDAS